MTTETVILSQLSENKANPRKITERKLNLLIERLLVFPKMIKIRPIVVDDKMMALGGNMRIKALNVIASMSHDKIKCIVSETKNYKQLTETEKQNLLNQWAKWLKKPTAEIVRASELSQTEKQEFIIADNASFGEWDYEKLSDWDDKDLTSWGVDVWTPEPYTPISNYEQPTTPSNYENTPSIAEDIAGELPEELQGIDITPDDLPKLEGDDETPMERVIITYPKDRENEIASLLGLSSIDKVIYSIDEVILHPVEQNL